jgi:hypothetical protein
MAPNFSRLKATNNRKAAVPSGFKTGFERKLTMSRLNDTAMKNEAPFILEWVAYHRMIGYNVSVW